MIKSTHRARSIDSFRQTITNEEVQGRWGVGGWGGIEGGGRDVWDPVAVSEFAPTDPISSLCRTFPISSLVLVRGVRAFKYRETWTFHIV